MNYCLVFSVYQFLDNDKKKMVNFHEVNNIKQFDASLSHIMTVQRVNSMFSYEVRQI